MQKKSCKNGIWKAVSFEHELFLKNSGHGQKVLFDFVVLILNSLVRLFFIRVGETSNLLGELARNEMFQGHRISDAKPNQDQVCLQ